MFSKDEPGSLRENRERLNERCVYGLPRNILRPGQNRERKNRKVVDEERLSNLKFEILP